MVDGGDVLTGAGCDFLVDLSFLGCVTRPAADLPLPQVRPVEHASIGPCFTYCFISPALFFCDVIMAVGEMVLGCLVAEFVGCCVCGGGGALGQEARRT